MKHYYYCEKCKKYFYLDMTTVNNCPRCGYDMTYQTLGMNPPSYYRTVLININKGNNYSKTNNQ